jgi:two-component system cell cycle sensor histidine kinase PleC
MSLKSDEPSGDGSPAFGAWAAMEKPAVLIVDDEPQLVTAITDALDEQYRVIGETSAKSALEILREDPGIHVIISDQRMPVMTGDEFLFRAQEISSATRILVTAYADIGAIINAVNRGKIFNYIRKPWNESELRNTVDNAVQHFALSAALLRERTLLKCIMDCSLDAISVKDTRHRYIQLNGAEAAMLGANSVAEVNGSSHAKFLDASRADRWNDEEDRLLETLEALRDRIEHVVEGDGTERWYATTKAPIRPSSGTPIGLVSITRDVTENKSIEQIKDDFIATARHELRTPLTVIVGTIKLIRSGRFGTLTPKADDLLIRSEASCDRLLRLINDMLDIQDIMVGKANIEMVPILLQDLINESRVLNEPLARANEINVQISGISPDMAIIGNRQRLIQVLCNLLSNACRFSPKQTKVNITVLEQLDHVLISVIDQGPGVPTGGADKLFKSFSQLDSSTSRSHEGAGLGLRICKAIAEAHGGQIGFMPVPSVGSNFFLILPRDQSHRTSRLPKDVLVTETGQSVSLT